MENKKIIIIIILVALSAVIGLGIYYLVNNNLNLAGTAIGPTANSTANSNTSDTEAISSDAEEAGNQNSDYIGIIIGTINFLDKGSTIKTIIKASSGGEYSLSPAQPKAIYESFGIKDGSEVQIQGKIINNEKVEWLSIKAI